MIVRPSSDKYISCLAGISEMENNETLAGKLCNNFLFIMSKE